MVQDPEWAVQCPAALRMLWGQWGWAVLAALPSQGAAWPIAMTRPRLRLCFCACACAFAYLITGSSLLGPHPPSLPCPLFPCVPVRQTATLYFSLCSHRDKGQRMGNSSGDFNEPLL